MNLEVTLLVWHEIKEHIIAGDRSEAAEDFVRVLIEHGAEVDDITAYGIDNDIKKALRDYGEVEEEHFEDHDLEEEWNDIYL